ncbi:Hypothetical predicted protein [Mytilus galloprovincialis]|uniref:C3H1-type domain-containing protein n=1 Tax=Mytilus galloprovincialis TaxID=29158 RepID=A0A8B6CZ37_MYTGA|nr:Hypothetical predicted protein [Mytilus galloprovincialis]
MAEGHDAEKLRDIIESLRAGKQKQMDSNESDDDFQESFEELDQENGGTANPKLDTAHDNSEMETSEPINFSQPNKEQSALQILSFIWPEPVEQFQTFTLGGEVEFRVGKKKTLDKVTIEEWGYANIRIMQELLKQKRLSNIQGYLNYTADIYRLAARNVWYSVLLYDKEYRQKQADELFEWGIYRQDLRDFQLVSKRDNPTFRAFSEASVGASKGRGRNSRPGIDERRKGPFLPDGREICRNFNSNSCFRSDCRMMHSCAICFSNAHSALNGHSQPTNKPKNLELPQNRE